MKHVITPTRLLVLATVAPIVAFSVAQAQSGGGYELTWSTVDGGGLTWSAGGGYSLGGTSGQHDAQTPATGGSYTLQGGFWHPVCRPQAVAVTIACVADQVQLSWTSDDANMAYDIYRATIPYTAPALASKQATALASPWTDPQTTCGDPGTNYYYMVRSTCVGAHADAGEKGEFDFTIVPGS
jgi:hypothetical protein